MIKEGKFGAQEAICLMTITISSKMFFTSPAFLARFVATAGWYMTLISAATATMGFTLIYLLLKRFPGKDIVEIFEIALGRFLGFILSFVLSAYLMLTSAIFLREFIEVIKVFTLPLSPPSFLIGIAVVVIISLCFLGLEAMARFSRLAGFALLFSYLAIIFLSSQHFDIRRLFPILGNGLGETVVHGLRRSSAYGEVVTVAVIASSLQGSKYIKKTGYISLVLSGLLISSALLCFALAFPAETGVEITAPVYEMIRQVNYSSFFQRLDPIFLFTWNIATLITVTFLFYCSISIYCKMFRIQDMRPVILPAAILYFTIVLIPKDLISVVTGYIQNSREYGWIIYFGLPLVALIAAVLRKKKGAASVA